MNMEDTSFAKMMESREASKERGYPSGFRKSQCLGGAKPGNMGRDKDWPMPANIPKGKSNEDTKSSEIKKSEDGFYSFKDMMAIKKASKDKKSDKKNTDSNAKTEDRVPEHKRKEQAQKQIDRKESKEFLDFHAKKRADRNREAVESGPAKKKEKKEAYDEIQATDAVTDNPDNPENLGDYDLTQYDPENTPESEVAADDVYAEPGTEIVDEENIGRVSDDSLPTRTVTADEYGDAVDDAINQKLATNPYYGAVAWNPWTKDDQYMDEVERQDRADAAEAERNHDLYGGRAETAQAISTHTGEPVQTALNGDVVADADKIGTKADKVGAAAINLPEPRTEQARLIDGNMVSSKGVTPLESQTGTKNGKVQPPAKQTNLNLDSDDSIYNHLYNRDTAAANAESMAPIGMPSFRELMGDKMQNGVTAYHDLASNKTHGHGENKLGVSRTEYGDLRAGTRNNGRMPEYKEWGPKIRGL